MLALRAAGNRIPVIMISGSLEPSPLYAAVSREISAALPKPVHVAETINIAAAGRNLRDNRGSSIQSVKIMKSASKVIARDLTDEPTKTSRPFCSARFLWPLSLLVVATLAGCAGTSRKTSSSFFGAADTNADKRVSRAEYAQAKFRRIFDKLDLDRDQKISLAEWKRIDRSAKAEENFKAMDEDSDQFISVAEFLKLAPQHSNLDETFTALDQDADEALTDKELQEQPAVKLFSIPF